MTLNTQQQILIEQRITNDAKSTGVAYILWFFFAGLGGHRFYLGRTGSAVTMLILTIVGFATVAFIVGAIPLIVVAIWALVDAFLIPGMIRDHKDRLRQNLTMSAMLANESALDNVQQLPQLEAQS